MGVFLPLMFLFVLCRLDPSIVRFPSDEAARHAVVDLLVRR
jgi:hypothetical protein